MQEAIKCMRHSKRTVLTAEDVDSALSLRNVEVGFLRLPPLTLIGFDLVLVFVSGIDRVTRSVACKCLFECSLYFKKPSFCFVLFS